MNILDVGAVTGRGAEQSVECGWEGRAGRARNLSAVATFGKDKCLLKQCSMFDGCGAEHRVT